MHFPRIKMHKSCGGRLTHKQKCTTILHIFIYRASTKLTLSKTQLFSRKHIRSFPSEKSWQHNQSRDFGF